MYGKANLVGQGSNSNISTTEADVLSITSDGELTDSQFTIYHSYAKGTHTSLKIRYYARFAVGGDWYQIPARNEADGTIDDQPTVVDASSPADRFLEEVPVPACMAFKITAQGVGGANGTLTSTILARDN